MHRKIEPNTALIDYTIYRGDTFYGNSVRVVNEDGTPVLGNNGKVHFGIFRGENPILIKSYTAADRDENGYIQFGLLPDETAELTPREYSFEVEFEISDTEVFTAIAGTLTVIADKITPEVREHE